VSEKKATKTKALLDTIIDKHMEELMNAILADPKIPATVKASRVGLASTALHHLKLLRGALE